MRKERSSLGGMNGQRSALVSVKVDHMVSYWLQIERGWRAISLTLPLYFSC